MHQWFVNETQNQAKQYQHPAQLWRDQPYLRRVRNHLLASQEADTLLLRLLQDQRQESADNRGYECASFYHGIIFSSSRFTAKLCTS
jgi:hypothetical protein